MNFKSTFWIWIIQNDTMIEIIKKNTFIFLPTLRKYWSSRHREIFTEFWLSAIRPVAHSLSDRLIKDVLQFNGSLYSEEIYDCEWSWNLKIYENFKVKLIWKFLKWNSYEKPKIHHNSWEGILQNLRSNISSNLFGS